MSADNGVYILVTRGPRTRRGHKMEYRVVHAQAIEIIRERPDYPDWMVQGSELNREAVLKFFGKARVFTDRRVAEGYAQAVYDAWMRDVGFVEYGIVWLNYSHISFPKRPNPGVQHQRHRRGNRRWRLASVS